MVLRSPRSPRPTPRRPVASLVALGLAATLTAACSAGPEPTTETLPPGTSTLGTSGPPATGRPEGTTLPDPGTVPGSVPGSLPEGPGSATVEELQLENRLSCTGEVDVEVSATYRTTGATDVTFLVDGRQVAGDAPVSGRFAVPLRCDDRSHTVVLVAVDPDGRTTVESRVVLTSTTPAGN